MTGFLGLSAELVAHKLLVSAEDFRKEDPFDPYFCRKSTSPKVSKPLVPG